MRGFTHSDRTQTHTALSSVHSLILSRNSVQFNESLLTLCFDQTEPELSALVPDLGQIAIVFLHLLTAVRKMFLFLYFFLNPTVNLLLTAFLALISSSLPNYCLLMLSKVNAVMASPNFSKVL